jgi:hypothetical protein
MEQSYTQASLRHNLTIDSKDDPVPGQTKDALSEPKNLEYPQKILLRVVAT